MLSQVLAKASAKVLRHPTRLLAVSALVVLIALGPELAGRFLGNVGLVMLNRSIAHRGVIREDTGTDFDLVRAEAFLSAAAQIRVDVPAILRGRALLATIQGRRPEAFELFRQLGINVEGVIAWGDASALKQEWAAALRWYDWAIAFAPEQSDPYAALGQVYEQLAKPDEALRAYQAALDRGQFTSAQLEQSVWYRAGVLLVPRAAPADLVTFYRRAVTALPDDAYLHAALGRALYQATHQLAEAEAEFRRAIVLNPETEAAYLFWAEILLQMNQPQQALPIIQQALSALPESVVARVYAGWAYFLTNDLDQAQAQLAQALASDPSNAVGHLWSGQVALKRGEYQQAVQHFRQVIASDPNVFGGWYYLGEALRLSGDLAGAREAYQAARQIDPANALVQQRLQELRQP